jgi:hypothetical protein
MKYPHIRDKLLGMLSEDQQEVKDHARKYGGSSSAKEAKESSAQLTQHSVERASQMLKLLHEIKQPTIENIGENGSQAISIIALHSKYSIMKEVLAAFQNAEKENPHSTYHEAIPTLTDRVRVLEKKKQLYATHWMKGSDGKYFLYPVEDFTGLKQRRAQYELGEVRRPTDLATDTGEAVKGQAVTEQDQREPTAQEYRKHTHVFFDD